MWQKKLNEYLENKKIYILGLGVEGRSVYKYIRNTFPDKNITIGDINDKKEDLLFKEDIQSGIVKTKFGDEYIKQLEEFDIVFKSPGVHLYDIKKDVKEKLHSQIDIFLKFFDGITIGITGSKGKSTTSTLMYEVIKNCGYKAELLGNIGIPVFDRINEIDNKTICVIELSSFALEEIDNPVTIGVILNLYTAHLDYHKTYDNYGKAKMSLFENMKNNTNVNKDITIFDNFVKIKNRKYVQEVTPILRKLEYNFSDFIKMEDEKISLPKLILKGEHNIKNAKTVKKIALDLGLPEEKIDNTLINFKGLKHRLEFVKKVDNSEYYNDSIATIPESTLNAIKSIPNLETLIIGGDDKEMDPTELISYINSEEAPHSKTLKNIILLPDSGHRFKDELSNRFNKIVVFDMAEAVKEAFRNTKSGNVLLSPAARSYGYFKNFEDRGDQFKKYVNELRN